MSCIIKGTFDLIRTTMKSALLVGGALAITAVCTKPNRKSFDSFFDKWLQDNIKKVAAKDHNANPIIAKILGFGGSTAIKLISSKYIDDYAISQLATVNIKGQCIYFIGAFNGWYYVGSSK